MQYHCYVHLLQNIKKQIWSSHTEQCIHVANNSLSVIKATLTIEFITHCEIINGLDRCSKTSQNVEPIKINKFDLLQEGEFPQILFLRA